MRRKIKNIFLILLAITLCAQIIFGNFTIGICADNKFKASKRLIEPYVKELKKIHPNWTFTYYDTGLDWNTVIKEESYLSRNLVPESPSKMTLKGVDTEWYYTPTSWKSTDISGAYDWDNNCWVGFSGGGYVQASDAIIRYMIDPRNWITEANVFSFEQLSYNSSVQTKEVLVSMMKNSYMDCDYARVGGTNNLTYADVLMEMAELYNVSPVYLCSKLIYEKGRGKYNSKTGKYEMDDTLGNGVKGTDGIIYYNMFNIQASGQTQNDVIKNGLNEAKSNKWTSQYLAIKGGAQKISSKYIPYGQTTLYFQKFAVSVPEGYRYWKQYQQAIYAAVNEGYNNMEAYKKMGKLNSSFSFVIPVYYNMPEKACSRPMPNGTQNPNYKLKNLTVSKIYESGKAEQVSLTPTFNKDNGEYSIVVPYAVNKIKIEASAIAKTSSISGTGTHSLKVGNNEFNIVCKSEYGTTKTYKVRVTRKEGSTYLTSLSPGKSGFNETFNMNTYKYTMRVANDVTSLALNYKTESSIATVEMRTGSTTTVLSNGTTGNINLPEGTTKVYIDVYPSASDRSERKTYEVDITRLTKVSVDFKNLKLKDSYIHNFAVGDTVNTALQRLKVTGGTAQITDSSGNVKSVDKIIGTGDMLRIHDSNGTLYMSKNIVIYGDVNGDGKIDMFDAAYLKKHVWKKPFLTGIMLEAANVYDKSDGIDIMDMAVIKKCMWYGGTINQKRN